VIAGIILFAGQFVRGFVTGQTAFNNGVALNQVEQANNALTRSSGNIPAALQACSGQLSCVTALLRKETKALETFNSEIKAISMSSPAAGAAARLLSDNSAAVRDLNQLASATSNAQYLSIASTSSLQQDLSNATADYGTLVKDLSAS
jgi:hypothetical protein